MIPKSLICNNRAVRPIICNRVLFWSERSKMSNFTCSVFVSRSVNSKYSLPVSSSRGWISDHLSMIFNPPPPLIQNIMVFFSHILLSNAFELCKPMHLFSFKIFSSKFVKGSAALSFPSFNSLHLEIFLAETCRWTYGTW